MGSVGRIAFSPDGKFMVTGGDDGTPLVWDLVGAFRRREGVKAMLTGEDLAAQWCGLSAADGGLAWQSVKALIAVPQQAVPLLRERLLEQVVTGERVKQLVADLDADTFKVRQRASQELAALGKAAEAALRQAQTRAPSAEAARRLEKLLARLDQPGLSAPALAGLRAVEVLEHIGTYDAQKLLATLQMKSGDARLRREAGESLRRLDTCSHR
jgi:hypothetical protein